ncbi:MAG: tetratricopeptide repeat protein, partial [Blastocatellia bacterium]
MKNNPRRQEESRAESPSTSGATGATVSEPAFFLLTKLLPPRPALALLERPRLVERLAGNLARPVTLVTANAGSGKTTLVAGFVRAHAQQFVWYQLDHTDADPAVFLGYIAYGIRQIIPDFGQATLAYLRQSAAEVAQHPERAVDVLLNEALGGIDQQLILVLDDYHHLGAETPVHAAVDRLLTYLPDVMHMIIISREAPPLQSARLRSQARLAVIDRNDLLFTDEETQALFHEVFGLELAPHQLAEYRERTQGWITALQLVRQVARRQMTPDLVEILRQSESDIFDYFAEEVFAGESLHVQQLLLRLSLLERIDPETCGRLYPEADCSATLPALVRRNVFMTSAGDASQEEYRLHPLFGGFLRRRLRSEVGRLVVAAEQTRIASYFLERGYWEQAIHYLLAAEDFDRAAELIAEKGQAWVAGGALSSLVSSVDALPAESLERNPRALVARAEVARLRGEYDAAQGMLRRAAHLLNARNDREGEAEALHGLATIARRRGDFTAAFDYLDRAIELTDEHSAVRARCGNTRGLCLVAMRQWTEAEREFRTALYLAEEQRDEHCARIILHNLGLPPMIRGDFGEALRSLRRLLRDEAAPVPQEATAHLNMARCHLYRGEMEACERHLERALERCQLFNLIAVRAEVFETYGMLNCERGDAVSAEEFYERAARAYEEAGIDPARCELLEERALLKLRMGDRAGARALLDRLIEARTELMDEMGVRTAMLSRGRVLLSQNELERARIELEQALDYFRQHKLHYYEVQACLTLALCDHAMEREVEMMERIRRVLDLATRYDYEYWLQREISAHPRLFATPD